MMIVFDWLYILLYWYFVFERRHHPLLNAHRPPLFSCSLLAFNCQRRQQQLTFVVVYLAYVLLCTVYVCKMLRCCCCYYCFLFSLQFAPKNNRALITQWRRCAAPMPNHDNTDGFFPLLDKHCQMVDWLTCVLRWLYFCSSFCCFPL